ncbi:cell wall hydrolase [Sphingomonas nostoxanthinifaciens]|uniref:cell wall hydrolase n=1 Tax=Sphingomonas nostoxanthinifaciens TaxID=2872652 RepID=UPI001CC20BC5|nr:cell wall hydrolase [Sphingomonas nostoxanthinifaciens]UAK23919.1 cell wall hydrolase [Sphingomonas nostoxanthinifaciens]
MTLLSLGGGFAAAAFLGLMPTMGHAADLGALPALAYDLDSSNLPQAAAPQPAMADAGDDDVAVDPAALECMAKVVMHEAGSEPRAGKVAVAQTLVNRLKTGRFGDSICAIAKQPGQFFNVASYQPHRDSDNWAESMAVSRAVLTGDADAIVPGAMFFRSAASPASSFFRSRARVAMVGAQVFYR